MPSVLSIKCQCKEVSRQRLNLFRNLDRLTKTNVIPSAAEGPAVALSAIRERATPATITTMPRTKPFIPLFATILAATLATSAPAQSPEEQAVLAPIQAMFDGMSKRDAAAIKAPTLPGGTMVLMRDGKPAQMTFEAFAERVGRPGKTLIEERIHDPLIRIDNDLALVWAPFDFLVDGKVNHCGTDLFNLVRVEGKWLIASIADTGTNTCPAK
jgi:hypothetical protein